MYQWITLESAINPDLIKENKENDESEADITINHAEVTSKPSAVKDKSPMKGSAQKEATSGSIKTQNAQALKSKKKAKPFADAQEPEEEEERPLETTIRPQPRPDST